MDFEQQINSLLDMQAQFWAGMEEVKAEDARIREEMRMQHAYAMAKLEELIRLSKCHEERFATMAQRLHAENEAQRKADERLKRFRRPPQ